MDLLLVLQLAVVFIFPFVFFVSEQKLIKEYSIKKLAIVTNKAFLASLILNLIILSFLAAMGAIPIIDPDYPDPLESYFMGSLGWTVVITPLYLIFMLVVNFAGYIQRKKAGAERTA